MLFSWFVLELIAFDSSLVLLDFSNKYHQSIIFTSDLSWSRTPRVSLNHYKSLYLLFQLQLLDLTLTSWLLRPSGRWLKLMFFSIWQPIDVWFSGMIFQKHFELVPLSLMLLIECFYCLVTFFNYDNGHKFSSTPHSGWAPHIEIPGNHQDWIPLQWPHYTNTIVFIQYLPPKYYITLNT